MSSAAGFLSTVEASLTSAFDIFRHNETAIALSLIMIGVGALFMLYFWLIRMVPLLGMLRRMRAIVLARADGEAFVEQFDEVERAFLNNRVLAHSWREFRDTLIRSDEPGAPGEPAEPIRYSIRPAHYLNRRTAEEGGHNLGFLQALPHFFVGFGLLFTFFGLVAALFFAVEGVSSPDLSVAQAALRDLLHAATFKFLTSVSGLGISLLLGIGNRLLLHRLDLGFSRLCEALEGRMTYISTETIAYDQFRELRRVKRELGDFHAAFPTTTAGALREAQAPLAHTVEHLAENLADVNKEALSQMAGEFIAELRGSAGKELRSIAETLGQLDQDLTRLSSRLAHTGEGFGNRVEIAAGKMESVVGAAAQVLHGRLNEGAERIETGLTRAGEEVAVTLNDSADRLSGGVREASGVLTGDVGVAAQALRERIAEVGDALGETLTAAAGSLHKAAGEGAGELRGASSQLRGDLEAAAKGLGATTEAAGSALRENLSAATGELKTTLADSGTQLREELAQAGSGLKESLGDSASQLSDELARAGSGLKEAAGAAGDALGSTLSESGGQLRGELERAASGLTRATSAAGEGLQKSVATAASNLGTTLGEAGLKLRGEIDQAGGDLSQTAEAAAAALVEGSSAAANSLREGVSAATGELTQSLAGANRELNGTLTIAAERTAHTLESGGESFGQRLDASAERLDTLLTPLSERLAALESGFERLDRQLVSGAEGFEAASRATERSLGGLSESAARLGEAAEPLTRIAVEQRAAADGIVTTVDAVNDAQQRLAGLIEVVERLEQGLTGSLNDFTGAIKSDGEEQRAGLAAMHGRVGDGVDQLNGSIDRLDRQFAALTEQVKALAERPLILEPHEEKPRKEKAKKRKKGFLNLGGGGDAD